jgi:hypothetical protein
MAQNAIFFPPSHSAHSDGMDFFFWYYHMVFLGIKKNFFLDLSRPTYQNKCFKIVVKQTAQEKKKNKQKSFTLH